MRLIGLGLGVLLALALAGCESGGERNRATEAAAGPDAPAGEAELAADAALANEAAAAEALDTELYGGSAAAGETDNVSAARIPTHTPAPPPPAASSRR